MNHEVVKKIGERAGVDTLMLGLLRRKALQVSRHNGTLSSWQLAPDRSSLVSRSLLGESEREADIV